MELTQRQETILSTVREKKRIGLQQLHALLPCSLSTLQRDIRYLHEHGYIVRNHGKLRYPGSEADTSNTVNKNYLLYDQREIEFLNEKKAIAQAAVALVEPGDVIYITHGTTTRQFARALPPDMPLTVFTDGLDIIAELDTKPAVRVFCMGGLVNYASRQIEQTPYIPSDFRNANIGKLIMGVGGISKTKGITFYDLISFQFLENFAQSETDIVVLADSSKFDKVSLANFMHIHSVNTVVCDDGIDSSYLTYFEENGVQCVVAPT